MLVWSKLFSSLSRQMETETLETTAALQAPISICIFSSMVYRFLLVLVGRIWLTIMTFYLKWPFPSLEVIISVRRIEMLVTIAQSGNITESLLWTLYFRSVYGVFHGADTSTSQTRGKLPLWYYLCAQNHQGSQWKGHRASVKWCKHCGVTLHPDFAQ